MRLTNSRMEQPGGSQLHCPRPAEEQLCERREQSHRAAGCTAERPVPQQSILKLALVQIDLHLSITHCRLSILRMCQGGPEGSRKVQLACTWATGAKPEGIVHVPEGSASCRAASGRATQTTPPASEEVMLLTAIPGHITVEGMSTHSPRASYRQPWYAHIAVPFTTLPCARATDMWAPSCKMVRHADLAKHHYEMKHLPQIESSDINVLAHLKRSESAFGILVWCSCRTQCTS